jgi:hypothetical protein
MTEIVADVLASEPDLNICANQRNLWSKDRGGVVSRFFATFVV